MHACFKDDSVQLLQFFADPPEELYFKEKAIVGETFNIWCESNGYPPPSYTIIHNDTQVVSIHKAYTIHSVEQIDAGFYKCIARNKFGNTSKLFHLTILGKLSHS